MGGLKLWGSRDPGWCCGGFVSLFLWSCSWGLMVRPGVGVAAQKVHHCCPEGLMALGFLVHVGCLALLPVLPLTAPGGFADSAGGLCGGCSEAVLAGASVGGSRGHSDLHARPRGHRGACVGPTEMNRCVTPMR